MREDSRLQRPVKSAVFLAAVTLMTVPAAASARRSGWPGHARDAQHTANTPTAAQRPEQVRWSTPVDLAPQYSGDDLLIHYGSPLVTRRNTVVVTVKVGAADGFQVEGHRGDTGALLWTLPTDYTLPAHNWVPPVGPTLDRGDRLWIPAAGGTLLRRTRPDHPAGRVVRRAFYGVAAYDADPAAFQASVRIATPITADARGTLYFGFVADAGAPLGVRSGFARLRPNGTGSWIAADTAAADPSTSEPVYNAAPALSPDGGRLYVAVRSSAAHGYLLALDSATLAPVGRVRLTDPATGNDAFLSDDGSASPTVGPDGDVYYGVLENPFPSHHFRGWLLHFDATLATPGIPGAFGWDDTASIVPASAVPSYAGSSPYLLLTKYNDYVQGGGDGVNRLAVVDPRSAMTDPLFGATVMQEVLTVTGPTPDDELRDAAHPLAVREWCINTAAVDAAGQAALVNNEDGLLYRWNFSTNTLDASVVLTAGIGEAYTPTIVGPDGTVYAINNAILFATGAP